MLGFLRRGRPGQAGFDLYGAAVAAARDTYFYTELAVPDTVDGRFDMVGLHAYLLIRRLRHLPPPGPDMAQAVFDVMFDDMDVSLREMGVGDLSVGKKVKAMWEAFHGRAAAYETALAADDPTALAAALARNVWRGGDGDAKATTLAVIVRAQDAHLTAQDSAALRAGHADFLTAATAARR